MRYFYPVFCLVMVVVCTALAFAVGPSDTFSFFLCAISAAIWLINFIRETTKLGDNNG